MDPNWDADGPPPPNSPCWSDQYGNVVESDRFSVQWEDNAIDQGEAEDFLDSLSIRGM